VRGRFLRLVQAPVPLFAQTRLVCRGLAPIRLDSGPGVSSRGDRLNNGPSGAEPRGLVPRRRRMKTRACATPERLMFRRSNTTD
jgi:hypothetical protein